MAGAVTSQEGAFNEEALLRVHSKRLALVEEMLTAANKLSLQVSMPIQREEHRDEAAERNQTPQDGHNTEQRWLSRMVNNALGQLKHRVVADDTEVDNRKEQLYGHIASRREALQTKKRMLQEARTLEQEVNSLEVKVAEGEGVRTARKLKTSRPSIDPRCPLDVSYSNRRATAGSDGVGAEELTVLKDLASLVSERMADLAACMPGQVDSFSKTVSAVRSYLDEATTRVDYAIAATLPSEEEVTTSETEAPLMNGSGKVGSTSSASSSPSAAVSPTRDLISLEQHEAFPHGKMTTTDSRQASDLSMYSERLLARHLTHA